LLLAQRRVLKGRAQPANATLLAQVDWFYKAGLSDIQTTISTEVAKVYRCYSVN
jgi:hypothetical protein